MTSNGAARILNVDDDPGNLYAKTRVLRRAGFDVLEAENGSDALRLARAELPDLILLDVRLPDIDGIEVCGRIKNDPALVGIPVIQTSATFTTDEDKVRGLRGGADAYLPAPFGPDELLALVEAMLRVRRAEQARERLIGELEAERDKLHRRNEQLQAIGRATAHMLGAHDAEAMLDELFALLGETLALDAYMHYAWVGEGDLRLAAAAGVVTQKLEPSLRLAADDAGAAAVSFDEARQPLTERLAGAAGLGVLFVAPLAVGERRLGLLAFGRRAARAFDAEEIQVLATVAGQIATALERLRAEDALYEADRRKDEFLATLAHELRNPLAPMTNAMHLIRLEPQQSAHTQRAAAVLERQLRQMTRLVDDLLDVSRITRDRIELRREPIVLSEVLAAAMEISRPLLEAGQQRFHADVATEPLWLNADTARLAQVFSNLLNNAAKYTPAGGKIELSAWRQGDQALVQVSDSGRGIPPQMLARVFDLFTQVDHSTDSLQGGLGIGLTVARRLVEIHGGSIEAHSPGRDQGSRFLVRLPLIAPPAPVMPVNAEPDALTGGERELRVLVVDDNRDAADSLALLLRVLGLDARVAHSGEAALSMLEELSPQLAFLDLGMPGMDGFELARRIRAAGHTQMLLVAISGWGQEQDRARSRAAGFDLHLVKPADVHTLQALIEERFPRR